jgi:hypothetical protein
MDRAGFRGMAGWCCDDNSAIGEISEKREGALLEGGWRRQDGGVQVGTKADRVSCDGS